MHQDASGKTKPSGSLTINQSVGDVFFQGQIARNASARAINQYESRWRLLGDGTSYLSYPSYTRDDMSAESWVGNFRADYDIRAGMSLSYEATATRYQDTSFRTKLENQIATGAQIPESYELGGRSNRNRAMLSSRDRCVTTSMSERASATSTGIS